MTHVKLSRTERRIQALESGECLFCFGGKDAPDAPDMSAVAGAASAQADAAREAAGMAQKTASEQLAWAKEQWADQKDMIGEVTDVQLPLMQAQVQMAQSGMNAYISMLDMQQQVGWENHKNAMQDRDRYERVFQPIEDDLVMEFMNYDTEGRRALEAGRAQADVSRAQDAQRKQSLMSLEGYGIDPSQTRSGALDASLRTQQAASQAAAGNAARELVADKGRALRADAINIGKGMPSQVSQSYNTALAAGQGAQGAAGQAQSQLGNTMSGIGGNAAAWQGAGGMLGNSLGYTNAANSFMGTGNQAIGQWGNTLNQGFQNEMSAYNANQQNSPWNTIAGIGGAAMGAFLAEGGEVQGPGGRDQVPAKLTHGEFIIPDDVVRRKGTEFFEKLIDKTKGEQAGKDQEMAVQQSRERAWQGAQAMPPTEAPMQTAPGQELMPPGPGPGQGQPVMMAEGGTVPAAPAAPPAPKAPAAGTPAYSGRNQRPMFGYDSALARQGQQQANQAIRDRQAMMANLRTELQAKKWKDIKPGWNPAKLDRADFDISGAVNDRRAAKAAQLAAQRAHEMAMARLAAENQQKAKNPWEDFDMYEQEPWRDMYGNTDRARQIAWDYSGSE